MERIGELNLQIDEVKGFMINTSQDVDLAQYAVDQQVRFLKQKEAELDALKDLFNNMIGEREELSPGSITEEAELKHNITSPPIRSGV